MQFRILGPMEVLAGSAPVDTGSPKQRAVLAMLLIEANRVVSLDRLIDQLWGDEAPARATGSLQVYVANLRRALEPDRPARAPATVLVTQPPGYLVRVDAADLDTACFEHLAAEGRRLLAEGHPGAARRALSEALALWRGPALAEFAFESFAQAEISRLEELRWLALEDRLEADLALGHHAESVADLEHLVAERPLRERLRSLLMVALYRSGRQAEALRTYQDARHRLAEELGIDPGPSLQRLETDILQHAASLDWHAAEPAVPGGPGGPEPAPAPPAPDLVPLDPDADDGDGTAARFVGRDEQLAALQHAFDQATAGRGRMVLLCGEAGIGKTTLADELGRRAVAAGALVLWGRCYEGEGAPPFWPWAQVLRDLVEHSQPAQLVAAVGAGAADLVQLVPEIGTVAPAATLPASIDPEAARFRLYDSTTRFLLRASAARPLVLVLDDLHWADVASLRLLQFLTAELRGGHLLVIGTFRDAEVQPGHPLAESLGALAREPALERLLLDGLDRKDVARYIEKATGSAVDEGVVDDVHDRTEGNPFFIEELVRLLASEGRLSAPPAGSTGNGGGWGPRAGVPVGVGDTIRRRVGRLPEDAQTVLTMASVVGREFDLDVLAVACQLGADRVVDLVESAILTGIVTECPNLVGRLRFSHALTRETLYEGLSALRRARLHARVGQALEAVTGAHPGTRLAELAHHFGQAAPAGFTDKAVAYAVQAADRAASQLAYEEVARYCQVALATFDHGTSPDPDLRFDLLLRQGRALKSAGDQDGARAVLQHAAAIARAAGEPSRLARVATSFSGGNWWGWWSGVGVVDHAAVNLLEEALEALGDGDSAARATVLGRLAGELYFTDEVGRRRELADEAVAVARRLGREDTLAKVLRDQHVAVWEPGNPEERLAIADELVELAAACGRRDLELLGRTFRLLASLQLGDAVTADAELDASEAIARELRAPVLLGHIGWGRSMKALLAGRFTEAEARIHENLAATQRFNQAEAVRTWSGQLVQLYEQQGRMSLLEPTVRGYIEIDPVHLVWRTVLALLLAEDGRMDEAREHFEIVARHDFTDTPRDVAWQFALAARAEVCTLLEDSRRAAQLYELLAPYDQQVIVLFTRPLCAGAVAHYVGSLALVLERYGDAEAHLRRAVELHEGLGARPFLARSQLRLAEVLLRRGSPDDAGEAAALLGTVAATAAELGMAGLARRVQELTLPRRTA